MKLLIVFLIQIFISTNLCAIELLSEKEFTQKYITSLMKQNKDIEIISTSTLKVIFKLKQSEEQQSFLDNAYLNYKSNPSDIDEILERYGLSMLASIDAEDSQFTKDKILPVLKDYLYIKQTKELMKDKSNVDDELLVYEKLNEILYIVYAFDTLESIRFLSSSDLERLDIKKSQLKEIAIHNLLNSMPQIQTQGDTSGLSMIIADGNYEASFLLVDELWTKENFPVKGDIVVYIPSRDTVLVTGSEDKENLDKIHTIMYSPEQAWPYIVADVGFIRTGSVWVEYKK